MNSPSFASCYTADPLIMAAGHHDNSDFVMQKYLLLHNQHEELRQQLQHNMDPFSSASSSASSLRSPSVSPTRGFTSNTTPAPPSSPRSNLRRSSAHSAHSGFSSASSSMTLDTVPEDNETDTALSQHAADPALHMAAAVEGQQKLSQLNEGIKRALTELLNCDAVRHDRGMRTWVQGRLMDTEKELRSGRRRRSNGSMSSGGCSFSH